jgi:hypothetical protein
MSTPNESDPAPAARMLPDRLTVGACHLSDIHRSSACCAFSQNIPVTAQSTQYRNMIPRRFNLRHMAADKGNARAVLDYCEHQAKILLTAGESQSRDYARGLLRRVVRARQRLDQTAAESAMKSPGGAADLN